MNKFIYSYPTKVYFGEGVALESLKQELPMMGNTIMLTYGKGSLKKSGIYDEIVQLLHQEGKEVIDFSSIMPNPTYRKVQEGANLAKKNT